MNITLQSGSVLPWADFEVKRVSRKQNWQSTLKSSYAVFKSGARINETKFPFSTSFLRTTAILARIAVQKLLSLLLYSHFVGRHIRNLPTMLPGREMSEVLAF